MQSSCPVPRSTSVPRILVTRNSHEYGCNFFEEAEVNAVFTLCTAPILVFLLCKLRRMNDAFKLRREMCWTYYTSLLLSSERTAACVAFDLTSIQPNVSSKVFAHRSRIVDIKCFDLICVCGVYKDIYIVFLLSSEATRIDYSRSFVNPVTIGPCVIFLPIPNTISCSSNEEEQRARCR